MFKRLLAVLVAAAFSLALLTGVASAKPVNWGDVTHHNQARGYTVGVFTCDPHSAGEGQGVTFKHRDNADALLGKLVKYGTNHTGIYKKLVILHDNRVHESVKFSCSGLGSGIHT